MILDYYAHLIIDNAMQWIVMVVWMGLKAFYVILIYHISI